MIKFPIGVQDFPLIRKENFLYVDKTEWIYRMMTTGVGYFLSRSRRFGKSLLVSTLESLFRNERELFKDLWIDSSDYDWKEFPVVRLDLSKTISSSSEALSASLQELLQEIKYYFRNELDSIAHQQNESLENIFKKIKFWYNGYSFSRSNETQRIYNPLSIMEFLQSGEFNNYWFATATPTFAIQLIKKNNYFIPNLENGIIVGKEIEASHEVDIIDLPTLLFQTGYLTIDKYDENTRTYFLKFPNEEVRRSFLDHLLQGFAEIRPSEIHTFLFKNG